MKHKQRSKKFSARATRCLTAGLTALLFAFAVSGSAGAQEKEGPPPAPVLDTGMTPVGPPPAPLLEWGARPADIPDGYMIIEGDIQVPIGFFELDMPWASNTWPGGVVPYEFDANVTTANRTAMRLAMGEWSAVAQVTFNEFGCDFFYCVHIQNSNVNNSAVGRQLFRQTINIFNWNFRFIMAHELAHALGFWHEQSRTDRNTYVTINYGNIIPGEEHNFDIANGSGRYGPYDYDSVMHYGRRDFSRNGMDTITVLQNPGYWQDRIGQRDHLSQFDALIMGFIYSRANWRFVDASYGGFFQFGTFFEPFRQFLPGYNATPTGGTLWVQPGDYSGNAGTYSRAMTWRAPLGGVTVR